MREIFKGTPIFSFKRAPTIGDRVVRSHLSAKDQTSKTWMGVDHFPENVRKGDRQRLLNQQDSRWIHKLQAMTHPGLNDSTDMVAFL